MEQYIWDEINNIKDLMMPKQGRIKKHKVCDEYVIVVNESPISYYFACAIMLMTSKVDSIQTHVIVCDAKAEIFINEFLQEIEAGDKESEKSQFFYQRNNIIYGIDEYLNSNPKYVYEKIRICTFLNAVCPNAEKTNEQEMYLKNLKKILEHAKQYPTCKLVHTEMIPEIKPLPGGITSISEREYELYCAELGEDSPEHYVLKSEELIRDYVKKCNLKAVVSRLQNVYGPGIENVLVDTVRDSVCNSKIVSLEGCSYNQHINMNYIRFAASQVHYMFTSGHGGHIYNLGQYQITPYNLYTQVYNYLADYGIALKGSDLKPEKPKYQLMCSKKAVSLLNSKYAKGDLLATFYISIISGTQFEYMNPNDIFIYDGKLDTIKNIELEMMAEIKRICEKYQIKYFLVGGSMLGAVRHKGFIPWDDDLDIGMLREDFEKFAQVAPDELDERYYYQSCTSDDNSHYIFDKIRLKDTFFSTKFSDRFEIQNGLFIDILVYDKTAKTKTKQNKHIKSICLWSRAINVRWVNVARKGIAYRLTKVLLPIMRLIPFGMYHKVFNKVLTRYNNTDSEWLIDGVGQNIRKGAFPAAWFDEIIDVPFEHMTLPIPKRYDEYLKHWYGDKYMQLLPISKRNSGHIMKRIDLGEYVCMAGFTDGKFHHASLKGELYDEY